VLLKVFCNALQFNALASSIALDWPAFLRPLLDTQQRIVGAVSGFYSTECVVDFLFGGTTSPMHFYVIAAPWVLRVFT
jgi:hypothetical protein